VFSRCRFVPLLFREAPAPLRKSQQVGCSGDGVEETTARLRSLGGPGVSRGAGAPSPSGLTCWLALPAARCFGVSRSGPVGLAPSPNVGTYSGARGGCGWQARPRSL